MEFVYSILLKAGIRVWASQKLKTNLGPVINSLGVRPLKKAVMPSFLAMLEMMRRPDSLASKFWFWMRVLTTSRGADTIKEAEAPAIEAMKFWNQVAVL